VAGVGGVRCSERCPFFLAAADLVRYFESTGNQNSWASHSFLQLCVVLRIFSRLNSRYRFLFSHDETNCANGGYSGLTGSRAPRIPTRSHCPPSLHFLIANPRLEIAATSTKERIGFKSNRNKIAIFQMRFARAARLLDALDQADLVDYANNGCIDRRIWAADSSHRGETFGGK